MVRGAGHARHCPAARKPGTLFVHADRCRPVAGTSSSVQSRTVRLGRSYIVWCPPARAGLQASPFSLYWPGGACALVAAKKLSADALTADRVGASSGLVAGGG